MASFGQFQRSGGPLVRLTPQGWVSETGENMSLPPGTGGFQRGGGDIPLSALLQGQEMGGQIPMYNAIPEFDRSQPVDYMGRKGFLQLDRSVIDAEGRRLMEPLQARERRIADEARALEKRKAESEIGLREAQAKAQLAKPTDEWHIDSASGMMINKRSGEIKPIGGGMSGLTVKEREAERTRSREAQEAIDITEEAKKYVKDAPGSYGGAALNQLGRVFGMETDATKAQAKLGVLGGALISKMPKMSGPQSDKDVALYKQMAGNLDDPTQPESAKIAAIETIQMLNRKYAGQQERGTIAESAGGGKQAPKPGTAKGGYVFIGGDPSQPSSWKKAQ